MRLRLKQTPKNGTIQWKFVSVFVLTFKNHYPFYYSSNSILKKLINFTRRLFDSEQLAVLRENKLLKSMQPDDTPLAMLQDVVHVLQKLKALVFMVNEHTKQQQSSEGPSKRKRTI